VNKRKQRQRQKFSPPLIALMIGGTLLIIAMAVYFAFGSINDGGGTPKLVVDQDKIDYGYVKFGNNKTFTIKVTNAGDGVLRFKEKPIVEVLEGC
jgi:hypothetical protein